MDRGRSALVLVDYQERLLPAIDGGARSLARALRLAQAARLLGVRVVGTEENPAGLGHNVAAVRRCCDATLEKKRFDACDDGLLPLLAPDGGEAPAEVVIAGWESHVCLLQTTLGLLREDRRVWVVETACASRSARDHGLAMARARDAGAIVVSDEMVLFEWLRTCEHPRFRDVLALAKAAAG